jgi:hypothetical protein
MSGIAGVDHGRSRALDLAGLALGVVAPIIFAAAVIWGATLVPGYSHVTDFISSLTQSGRTGTEPVEWLFLGYNGFLLVFATLCLRRLARSREWAMTFILLIVIAALGILMIPLRQDPVGDPITTAGIVHLVLAGLASLFSMGAIWFAGLAWRKTKDGEGLALFSFICLAIVFASGLLAASGAAGGWPFTGLLQRVTIGTFLIWMIVTATAFILRLLTRGVAIPHPSK